MQNTRTVLRKRLGMLLKNFELSPSCGFPTPRSLVFLSIPKKNRDNREQNPDDPFLKQFHPPQLFLNPQFTPIHFWTHMPFNNTHHRFIANPFFNTDIHHRTVD